MRRSTLVLIALCGLICVPALHSQDVSDYKSNPKFQAAMAEAKRLQKERQLFFALDEYKKANKIAAGKDADCLNTMLDIQMKGASFKDAAATASSLEALAANPAEKSRAETARGRALALEAGDKKRDLLTSADAAFKAAIADNPKNAGALYLDGQVLARLGQMDAARDQFKACLSCVSPNDPSYLRAQHFAEDPALSLHKMAPAFTVTALDGSKFNLDAMGGRVVLIDFWATWCGPCNEELPHLKKIAKEFAGQPLVIISVSWDSDETKWKNFINKNEMTWIQYRDADHVLSKNFGVDAIPHYFTIDSDGVLTAELLGSGSDVEGKLKKLIAKAKAAQPGTATQVGN
jgi:thiol-disulfide isomerase/thioredoxin